MTQRCQLNKERNMRLSAFCVTVLAILHCVESLADGLSIADGDVTFLSSYEVPLAEKEVFESQAMAAAKIVASQSKGMWLMYEELGETSTTHSARYFTVHFPDDLEQLTEPASDVYELVAKLGIYRVHAELTRQVPDWCSTTALDADRLPYAFVEYLWLKPKSLAEVDKILARRGEIMRRVYGTSSDGESAAEGFVAMVSPFQAMHVLFSVAESRVAALELLKTDLQRHELLEEWASLEGDLSRFVVERESRSGKFRRELSAVD